MADRRTFEEPVSGVRCSLDVPQAFAADAKLVSGLGYPWELATVRNAEIPHEIDEEGYGFPQIDALGSRGVVLWLIVGDRSYDAYQESLGEQQEGLGAGVTTALTLPQFTVTKVKGGRQRAAGGTIRKEEAATTRWESIRAWSRTISLDETKYCDLWLFAGASPFAPVGLLSDVVGGIQFEY